MESERFAGDDALARVAAVADRTAEHSRPHAWMLLWGAALTGAYVALLLALSAAGPSSDLSVLVFGLMLPTMLIYSAVVAGARERFGVRLRVSPLQWVVLTALGVGCALVGGIGLFGGGFPVWVAFVGGLAMFLALGGPAAMTLFGPRATAPDADDAVSAPLSRYARWFTVGIGAYLGLTTGSIAMPPLVVMAAATVGFVAILVFSLSPSASWSASRVGLEWGRIQWIGFAVATALMFSLAAVTIALGQLPTGPISFSCGLLVAGVMVIAAVLPKAK